MTAGDPNDMRDDRIRDHLANERTMLAWQRTALTVMGLGVLVDRIGVTGVGSGSAAIVGLILIAVGAAVSALGAYRFVRLERNIAAGQYRSGVVAHLALTAIVVFGGAILAIFLATNR